MTPNEILVIGGTGKTGKRVAERLMKRGVPMRVASRSSQRPFDWQRPDTWGPALDGATSAYVTYYPDLAVPSAAAIVGDFARLAVSRGVSRLVLLSGRGEEGAMLAEQAVQESGADWTILRSTWMSQNFSEGFFLEDLLRGELRVPAGDIREPFVDADDIADVTVAALTEPGHIGELYELTGPRLLTFADAVDEISRASRRRMRYISVGADLFASRLTEQRVPSDLVWLMSYLFTEVLDGRNAHLTDGVWRAIGHKPRDFRNYARNAAAIGVWEDAPALHGAADAAHAWT